MDAMLTERCSIPPGPSVAPPQARLPGEDDHSPAETPRAPTPDAADRPAPPQPRRARKNALLTTAAVITGVGIVAGAGYHERAQFGRLPVVQRLATVPMGHRLLAALPDGVAKPAPTLVARNDEPPPPVSVHAGTALVPSNEGGFVAIAGGAARAAPAQPSGRAVGKSTPASAASSPSPGGSTQAELREFDSLRSTAAIPATTGGSASPGAASTQPAVRPAAVGTTTAAAGMGVVGPRPVTAGAVGPTPAAHSASAEPSAPVKVATAPAQPTTPVRQDPVAEAVALKPTPVTPPQQVDLLHLMTQMGVVVRDLRTENAELRGQVAGLSEQMDAKLMQFDQRLSLAEAKGAIAAAMGAGKVPASTPTVEVTATAPAARKPPTPHPAPAPAPPLVRSVKDYSIQAASPGLAMLSTVGRDGTDTTSIQVSVGGEVPGVGRVKTIYQRGTNWVVETDHGVIQ